MRKYLLAGVAALVIAAPAAATTDNAGYVGLEGGILFPRSQNVSAAIDFTGTGPVDFSQDQIGKLKYKKGFDLDLIGGYDFGMFKVEGELGYKHAKNKSISISNEFITSINGGAGTDFVATDDFGLDGSAKVYSAMLNGLLDFGGNGSFGGYVGGGAGYASVHQFGNSSGKFAWQLIAGIYAPVSSNIDIGLKYRYFHAGSNDAQHDFVFTGTGTCGPQGATFPCSGGTATFFDSSRFTSNSLLASLVYNFGAPAAPPPPAPPPPPPPPAAPATQTCPDGSVILATDACPAPPPPPPPAPVERGERGQ